MALSTKSHLGQVGVPSKIDLLRGKDSRTRLILGAMHDRNRMLDLFTRPTGKRPQFAQPPLGNLNHFLDVKVDGMCIGKIGRIYS